MTPPLLGRVIPLFDEARDREWIAKAECRGVDTNVFYPPMHATAEVMAEAKSICAECSVVAECRDYAVRHNIRDGIWGGMNRRERDAYRRKARKLYESRR